MIDWIINFIAEFTGTVISRNAAIGVLVTLIISAVIIIFTIVWRISEQSQWAEIGRRSVRDDSWR